MPERRLLAHAIAWGGAALFGASLLWFLYSYLIRFDQLQLAHAASAVPGTAAKLSAAGFDILLFSVFALHHSALARTGAKRLVHTLVPQELERSLYTWVASALFIVVCTWWQPVPGELYRLEGAGRLLAYAVQMLGVILTIRASQAIDVLDLAGVRPVLQAASGVSPRHVPLKTTGLYGFVRHPLYFAWVLLVFGTPAMNGTRAVFAIVSTLYLAIAIPWEERGLINTFGPAYDAYRRKVRWRMVPGVY